MSKKSRENQTPISHLPTSTYQPSPSNPVKDQQKIAIEARQPWHEIKGLIIGADGAGVPSYLHVDLVSNWLAQLSVPGSLNPAAPCHVVPCQQRQHYVVRHPKDYREECGIV